MAQQGKNPGLFRLELSTPMVCCLTRGLPLCCCCCHFFFSCTARSFSCLGKVVYVDYIRQHVGEETARARRLHQEVYDSERRAREPTQDGCRDGSVAPPQILGESDREVLREMHNAGERNRHSSWRDAPSNATCKREQRGMYFLSTSWVAVLHTVFILFRSVKAVIPGEVVNFFFFFFHPPADGEK